MPNDNKKTEGNLKWPPEKTCQYSITEREMAIEDGEYIEIPVIGENKKEQTR